MTSSRCAVVYLLAIFICTITFNATAQSVHNPWAFNRARPTAAREDDNNDVAAWYAAHSPVHNPLTRTGLPQPEQVNNHPFAVQNPSPRSHDGHLRLTYPASPDLQAAAAVEQGHPFRGPRFRSIYNPSGQNAARFAPPPTFEPLPNVDEEQIAAAAQARDINHPTSSNLERYMPLLARKLGLTNNLTAHSSAPDPATQMPIDWQEEEEDEVLESQAQSLIVPAEKEDKEAEEPACVSAKCRTWITITIPEEGPIYPSLPKNKPEAPLPPINPLPTIPTKSILPKRRKIPNWPSTNTSKPESTTLSPKLTTKNIPPDFVFSTSWILPLKTRVTEPTAASITTATTPASPPPGGSWVKPYTLKPRPKVPGITVTTGPELVSGDGHKKNKPWTHSSSSVSSVKARPKSSHSNNRPAPTPETSIEEAAIWASTELIDAIKLALDRFRASLNRDGTAGHRNDMREVGAQLQTTWNQLRKGAWLERALAELAMSDAAIKDSLTPPTTKTVSTKDKNSAMPGGVITLPASDDVAFFYSGLPQPAIQGQEHLVKN